MNNYEKILEILKTLYNEDVSEVVAYTIKDIIQDVNNIENDSRVLTVHEKQDMLKGIEITINSADNTNYINKGMAHLKIDGEFQPFDLDLVANQYGVKAEARFYSVGNKYEVFVRSDKNDLDDYASMYAYHYTNDEHGQKELMNSSNEEVSLREGLDFLANMCLDKSLLFEKFGEIETKDNKRGKN